MRFSVPPRLLRLGVSALTFGFLGISASAASPGSVDFGRDVLPILSDKCFHCHGPDPKTRKGNLRLDTQDGAFRKDDPIIVPGKRDESELIRRILSEDAEETMPPPDSNRSLSKAQIETLSKWVEQGAKWGKHWAFVPPSREVPPAKPGDSWSRNEVDRFVLDRLDREGL
ncbi:c-type cytochrome domain-containing protein, partial [Singulisphaera rosea]